MKLFKFKSQNPDEIGSESIDGAENTEADENTSEVKKLTRSRERRNTLLRCLAAALAAAALLAVSGFSFFDLIRGAKESDAIQNEEIGSFVKREIFAILGSYDAELTDYSYSVVPMGGELVTVRFTHRYQKSANAIMEQTKQYIDGLIPLLDKYVVVQGTVEELSEEQSAMMYQWFAANKAAMVEKGMLIDTGDDTDYLSDKVLTVDTVNGKNQTLVLVLMGLAVLCLLYVIAELVLMAIFFFVNKSKAKLSESEANEDETAEKSEEAGINPAETSENTEIGQGDEHSAEGAEKTEPAEAENPADPEDKE